MARRARVCGREERGGEGRKREGRRERGREGGRKGGREEGREEGREGGRGDFLSGESPTASAGGRHTANPMTRINRRRIRASRRAVIQCRPLCWRRGHPCRHHTRGSVDVRRTAILCPPLSPPLALSLSHTATAKQIKSLSASLVTFKPGTDAVSSRYRHARLDSCVCVCVCVCVCCPCCR